MRESNCVHDTRRGTPHVVARLCIAQQMDENCEKQHQLLAHLKNTKGLVEVRAFVPNEFDEILFELFLCPFIVLALLQRAWVV